MRGRSRTRHLLAAASGLVLFACVTDGGETGMGDAARGGGKQDTLVLDLEKREAAQAIGPGLAEPAKQKYVRIRVTEVHNPRPLRLTFEVHYRPGPGEDVLLGTFALYPPDRPGDFVVATKGALRGQGSVVLSMQVLDEIRPGDELRVTTRPLAFTEK